MKNWLSKLSLFIKFKSSKCVFDVIFVPVIIAINSMCSLQDILESAIKYASANNCNASYSAIDLQYN